MYQRYHKPAFIGSDPLLFVHNYPDQRDREPVGLIAASLAYGNVKTINASIARVLSRLSASPGDFLLRTPDPELRKLMAGFRHRWTNDVAIANLLIGMRHVTREFGSLGAAFERGYTPGGDILLALRRWVVLLTQHNMPVKKELLSDPDGGSACKRLHLYLRWMVRRDEVDPGCWSRIDPADLLMPLDTHIQQFARKVRFTRRAAADHRTVIEITRHFRRLCPRDPLRYDFALTRFGMKEGWRAFNLTKVKQNAMLS